MKHDDIARRMDTFGRRRAAVRRSIQRRLERALESVEDQLARIDAEECAFLTSLLDHPDVQVSATARSDFMEPKDDDGGKGGDTGNGGG